MKSDLSTGIFRDLATTFSDLVRMTPQQIKNVNPNIAPDFLKIAAINAQNNYRSQAQPPSPPSKTVAESVVAQAAGVPASQPAPQTAIDQGVGSLPYQPNYEEGGIVSFAGPTGSAVQGDAYEEAKQNLESLYAQMKEAKYEQAKREAYTVGAMTEDLGTNMWNYVKGAGTAVGLPFTVAGQALTTDRDYYDKTGKIRSEFANPDIPLVPYDRFNNSLEKGDARIKNLEEQIKSAKSGLRSYETSQMPPKPDKKADDASGVKAVPQEEKGFSDYLAQIQGKAGVPAAAQAAGATTTSSANVGIPKLGIRGIPDAPGNVEVPTGPKDIAAAVKEARRGMADAGVDPDAELKRQQEAVSKLRAQEEKDAKEGKADLLIALGANIMAGTSGNALTNIGAGLKDTLPQVAEYRKQVKESQRFTAAAEEEANKAAYASKLGLYSQARQHMDTQKGYEMQASIANAGFQNQAYLTGVAAEEARLRANAQMANDNRNADRTNAMQEKALAVDVMKFERTLAAEEAKVRQAYSKNVMDNLIKLAMGEKVPPKDQAKLYSDLSTSSQISQQVAAWKKDHVDATPDQINEYKANLVKSEVDKITGMIQARARLDNQPWYTAILAGGNMPATLTEAPDSEN